MKLERKPRLKPRVPLAPMGDIAFLLIIFFMVSSIFIREAHIEVSLPESADIKRLDESLVSVLMNQDGELWVQGRPCNPADLYNAVESELTLRTQKTVSLKIDRAVRHDQFAPILSALSRTGAKVAWLGDREARR